MIKATGLIENEAFEEGLDHFFSKKGRNNPKNLDAYRIGYNESVKA